jgi:hypothetical protein
MPLQKVQLRPGLNREGTDYSNEGGWYDGDKIRFRSGFPEKIGGWSRLSNNTYLGAARTLWNWVDLAGNTYIGVGTNVKYYVEWGSVFYDITPYYYSVSLTNKISTSISTNVITITDTTYAPSVGDYIVITGATAVGGISATLLNDEHVITSVNAALNKYSFVVSATATSSVAAGGGTFTVNYEIPIGLNSFVLGTGWGASPWGYGGWGSPYTSSGIGNQLRLWTGDNFGENLLLAPRGGPMYYWQPEGTYTNGLSGGLSTRAQSLQTLSTAAGYSGTYVPNTTYQVITSAIQKFVIAFGANSYLAGTPGTPFNPMLVRWSDQLNPYQWVPDITNQSGEFVLTNGSYIMASRATRQEILIWTDSAIYSMQYIGTPYIWSFQILMDNISVMSPNAMITVNNVTYWMGQEKFYMYSGRVETLPCSLRQYIFADINKNQAYQVFAGANEGYNEVWWFYCSNNSNTVDKYVIYNYLDRVWYYGTLERTAWLDTGIIQNPVAAKYDSATNTGLLLYHESGVDDNAGTSPQPIDAYVQSSDFDIGDGHNFGFVWRILPDVNFNGSNVNQPSVTMTIKPRENSGTPYGVADNPTVTSGDNYTTKGEYTVQEFTGQVYTRLRGRQMAFRIESNTLGVAWQLGMPRIDIRPDGRR